MSARTPLRWLLVSLVVTLLASACSTGTTPAAPAVSTTLSDPTPLERWQDDYAYLETRTKPVEIVCSYVRADHGRLVPTPRRGWFLSFSDIPAVRSLFISPFDPTGAQPKRTRPDGPFRKCATNVPVSIPYRLPAINRFLAKHGLIYGVDSQHAHGLIPTDIVYAGRGPFRRYRNHPALFALALALRPQSLGGGPAMETATAPHVYTPGHRIIPPANDRQASVYQWFTDLLVHWYRNGKGY